MFIRRTRATHQLGSYEMALLEGWSTDADLTSNKTRTLLQFDGSIAEESWNHLGNFDLRSKKRGTWW